MTLFFIFFELSKYFTVTTDSFFLVWWEAGGSMKI